MEAQLVQTLQASLSPAAETRLAAEQALEQALANPGPSRSAFDALPGECHVDGVRAAGC